MLKPTLLAAIAIASCSAFAQSSQSGMMMDMDPKTASSFDLMNMVNMDAYNKLSAPDAYVLTSFISGLSANYKMALLRALAMNSQEARQTMMRNQDAANMMAPMGNTMPMNNMSMNSGMGMDVKMPRSYLDTIETLQKDQNVNDQVRIRTLFMARPFTQDLLMTPMNERELDAITRYFAANAKASEPVRLKYTSLAPRTYVSPVIPQ